MVSSGTLPSPEALAVRCRKAGHVNGWCNLWGSPAPLPLEMAPVRSSERTATAPVPGGAELRGHTCWAWCWTSWPLLSPFSARNPSQTALSRAQSALSRNWKYFPNTTWDNTFGPRMSQPSLLLRARRGGQTRPRV